MVREQSPQSQKYSGVFRELLSAGAPVELSIRKIRPALKYRNSWLHEGLAHLAVMILSLSLVLARWAWSDDRFNLVQVQDVVYKVPEVKMTRALGIGLRQSLVNWIHLFP